MPYCANCGTQARETQSVCLNCGKSLNFSQNKKVIEEETSTTGYAVLGFFMPVVGLVLYLIWLETKPKAARSAGIGALVGVISAFVFSILITILFVLLVTMGYLHYDNFFDFMNNMI
jgi:uncharacterized membrane protein YvbJ